jgi:ABC-2 type transport system permease protein
VSALVGVVRKEFRHVLRDPWMLIFSTVGTVILMILIGYAVSADIENIPIVVLDGDHSEQSRAYLQLFVNDELFLVTDWAQDERAVREHVRQGRASGAVIVPVGFSESIKRGEQATVQLIVDGTEPEIALQLVANAESLSAGHAVSLLQELFGGSEVASRSAGLPLEFRERVLYNPQLRELNSLLPALMGVVLAFPALAAALSLVREKEEGSLESLMSTPVRRHHLLVGKAVPYFVIGMLDILFLVWASMLIFQVPFQGRLADFMLLSGLFLFSNLGIGILLSSVLRTQMATLIIGSLVFMMPLTQSGLVTPLYTLSRDAQLQALVWPATHHIIIARAVFLKGLGMQDLLGHAGYLLVAGLVLNSLAVWRFKNKLA